MITTHIKQPREALELTPLFGNAKPLWELVDVAIEAKGLVPGAQMLTYEGQLANGVIRLLLTGGTDGERYLVTVRASDTEEAIFEAEMDVAVIEETWAMPDGGAPYVSIIDFVNRFGLDEVVRMTDASGSGRIDKQMLVNALVDAQAIADANLSGRYAVPLTTIPHIVVVAIADLARARLFPNGAPEGIATQAKSAERNLEQMKKGELPLGIPLAQVPPALDSDAPVKFFGGKRAYPNGLDDY